MREAVQAQGVTIGLGPETVAAVRRSVGTRPRQWLVAITLLFGMLAAVAVAAGQPADRTLARLSTPTQSLMSITVPFLGVLLAHDLKRSPRAHRAIPTLLAAVLLAAVIGVFEVVVCATTLAIAASGPSEDPWGDAGTIVVGSVLVQVVAQLTGTALGLLMWSAVIGCLATIVLPMGLWLLLGSVDATRPAQAWLAPYSSARHLLSGHMSHVAWAQWLLVLLIWGVAVNCVGILLLKHGRPKSDSRS